MDAWMLVYAWWRRFGTDRVLHGTAHDVLMALPALGTFFRQTGVIPASRRAVGAALAAGHDVVVWPGGEKDSMRAWTRRDQVELAGRSGFVRQAIGSGVPIVPVATVGGWDTAPVLFGVVDLVRVVPDVDRVQQLEPDLGWERQVDREDLYREPERRGEHDRAHLRP